MNYRKTVIYLLLLSFVICSASAGESWSVGSASYNARIEDIDTVDFINPKMGVRDDFLLAATQNKVDGWVWLKINIGSSESHVLLEGPGLRWETWIDGRYAGAWSSSFIPSVYSLYPRITENDITILIKAYLHRGFTGIPPLPVSGSFDELRKQQFLIIFRRLASPILGLIFGVILLFGTVASFQRAQGIFYINLAMFGLTMILASAGPIWLLLEMSWLGGYWKIPGIISICVLPFSISFWRRSITDVFPGKLKWLSFLDYLVAGFIAFRILVFSTGWLEYSWLVDYDPMHAYILMSAIGALELWLYGAANKWHLRVESLIILISGIAVPLIFFISGTALIRSLDMLLIPGLVISSFWGIIIMLVRGRELPNEIVPKAAAEEISQTVRSNIVNVIKSSFVPQKIPWDAHWDLAVLNNDYNHSSTSFYDCYVSVDQTIRGFSFLTSESNELESVVLSELVRSNLHRQFLSASSLAQLADTIFLNDTYFSAKALNAANIRGLVTFLNEDSMHTLPVGRVSAFVRKGGRATPVIRSGPAELNPALGSERFGMDGIKTIKISFSPDDLMLVYSPEIELMESIEGSTLGNHPIAEIFQSAKGLSASELLTDIHTKLNKILHEDAQNKPFKLLLARNRAGSTRIIS